MRVKLTEHAVERLKPGRQRCEVTDESIGRVPGFVLAIGSPGKKTDSVLYRFRGRQQRYVIGPASVWTLAQARDPGREVLRAARLGEDMAAKPPAAATFDAMAEEWMTRHVIPRKRPRSVAEDRRVLDLEVLPKFGKLPAAEVTRADVLKIIDAIVKRGSIHGAGNILATICAVFNWGVSQDLVPSNPCNGLKRPAPIRTRSRVLSDDELRRRCSGRVGTKSTWTPRPGQSRPIA